MILDEAEALLDPVSDIEGLMLACLVEASTGMVLASRKDQDHISLPEDRPPPAPAVILTVPLTSGWRNRPGCIRAR